MTADEYKRALARLGLSQVGAAPVFGISRRTAQQYAADGPSEPIAIIVRLLLALPPEKREKFLKVDT